MRLPLLAVLVLCSTALRADELQQLEDLGQWKQLRSRVESWYRQSPQDPNALIWMSKVKAAFGDHKGAYALAKQALALKENDAEVQSQFAAAAGQCAAKESSKLSQFSYAREMKKAGEKTLELNPAHLDTAQMMMQFYLQAPGIIGGSKEKAKELAQRFTSSHPAKGLMMQAQIALSEKDFARAEQFALQAAAKDPKDASPLTYLSSYYSRKEVNKPDQALAFAKKAMAAEPNRAAVHAQLCGVLADQGKMVELDAALLAAEKALPHTLLPFYAAARVLVTEGKELPKAEAFLKRYLTQSPEGGTPDHAAARWRLAQVMEKQGRKTEAITELETALKARPDFKDAQKDLERLKKA
jgi:tetratricopeptide (TPR) repeat protein